MEALKSLVGMFVLVVLFIALRELKNLWNK